jgi:hypothetical protein
VGFGSWRFDLNLNGGKMSTIQEVKDRILSGKHELWNNAIRIFEQEKTPNLGLKIRRALLVVAFRQSGTAWGVMTVPITPATKQNALQFVVRHYQEAKTGGSLTTFALNEHGIQFISLSDTQSESELACFPLGFIFVGPVANRGWANEVVMVKIPILAEMQEETALLEEFCFQVADKEIQELVSNQSASSAATKIKRRENKK